MHLPNIIEEFDDLPPAPRLLPQLQKLLRDPNTDQSDLVALLRVDSALTARIIRIANSAYYGSSSRSENLSDAISRLGFKDVYHVTSLAISSNVLGTALPAYNLKAGDLFEQSLACATLLSSLPKTAENPVDEETRFTIGLLHSIGKIVVNSYFLKRGMEIYSENREEELTFAEERGLLGFDHAEAGAAILHKWNFPERICSAIGYQLEPLKEPNNACLAAQLSLARWAVPFVLRAARCGGSIPVFEGPEILLRSGITAEDLATTMRDAQEAFAQTHAMMVAA